MRSPKQRGKILIKVTPRWPLKFQPESIFLQCVTKDTGQEFEVLEEVLQ